MSKNKGIAKPIESQELQWISKNQINNFTFPSATHKLFKLLNEDNEILHSLYLYFIAFLYFIVRPNIADYWHTPT